MPFLIDNAEDIGDDLLLPLHQQKRFAGKFAFSVL
jgi:hypothetical protein